MKEFNNLEEMEKYYNKEINAYVFKEEDGYIDIKINFDLKVNANIYAGNIDAWDINARNIYAFNIDALDINARDINARNIYAFNIDARDINARDIDSGNINAWDINARNIYAGNINADNIYFYAVCTSYSNIYCTKYEGKRINAVINTLDGDIYYKEK